MRNIPLPREVPMPPVSNRDRRRGTLAVPLSTATVKPIPHASDIKGIARLVAEQSVLVQQLSIDGLDFRAKVALNVCTNYRIKLHDQTLMIRDTEMRIVACRRHTDGMYDIAAVMCR